VISDLDIDINDGGNN